MARTSIYVNFPGTTENAFQFYKSVFGGEFIGDVHRFKDIPLAPGQRPVPTDAQNMIMHVELAITGGCILMGTDAPESMGFKVNAGNNTHINLEPDTRAETERLYKLLSAGGTVEMPLQDMFWGAYFASFRDKFGVCWMVNCANKV